MKKIQGLTQLKQYWAVKSLSCMGWDTEWDNRSLRNAAWKRYRCPLLHFRWKYEWLIGCEPMQQRIFQWQLFKWEFHSASCNLFFELPSIFTPQVKLSTDICNKRLCCHFTENRHLPLRVRRFSEIYREPVFKAESLCSNPEQLYMKAIKTTWKLQTSIWYEFATALIFRKPGVWIRWV